MGGFGLTGAPSRAIAGDGGHPGDGDCVGAHVCYCPAVKLLEKLNLDGLSNMTPWNVTVAKELVLAFHNIFALDGNELGCMSAIEHEIHINDSEPFKE